jgi:hypothetical protein
VLACVCWQARVRELELENARSRMQMVFVPGMLPDTAYLRLDIADRCCVCVCVCDFLPLPLHHVLQAQVASEPHVQL